MRTKKIIGLAIVSGLMSQGVASAAIPRLVGFQGRLADASGTPLSGSYSMVFGLYTASSGGTACFSETQTVAVNSGLFNISIGAATGGGITGCDFSVPYYIQLQVGTDPAMSPRIGMTSAAYAFRADAANDSALLGGKAAGNAAGNIPVSNGTISTNLNADMLDNKHYTDLQVEFATANHTHPKSSITIHNAPSYTAIQKTGTAWGNTLTLDPMYLVNGTYTVQMRVYATGAAAAYLRLSIDGANVCQVTVPTGTAWITASCSVTIAADGWKTNYLQGLGCGSLCGPSHSGLTVVAYPQ